MILALASFWDERNWWQRACLLFLIGASAALAHAPIFLFPAILPFLAMAFLIAHPDTAIRRRFRAAFFLFWGYYVGGLYWLAHAIATDLARFWWIMPFAVLGVPAFLALLNAPALWLASRLRLRGLSLVFGLSASWLLLDWVRGTVLTGFPWNMVGQIWAGYLWPLQFASVLGVWGLTAATTVCCFLLANSTFTKRWKVNLGLAAAIAALIVGFGAVRVAIEGDAAQQPIADVRIRLVQPVIKQSLKWDPEFMARNVQQQVNMSNAPSRAFSAPPTHVVWSESAVPYSLDDQSEFRTELAEAALTNQEGILITGANRFERNETGSATASFQVWNSLFALNRSGEIAATYDKSHLVPFGEYVPLRKLLSFFPALNSAMPSSTDFSAGPGPRTIAIPGLPPTSVNICYESIFPGRVTDGQGTAQLLLTITNDGWFGMTSGPHQHLAQARLRSVEEGLPQIRVSNPGISVVMDYLGRDLARIDLGVVSYQDSMLTMERNLRSTFAKLQNFTLWLLVTLMSLFSLIARVRSS